MRTVMVRSTSLGCAAVEQECEQCQNVKLEREVETLSVALEPGMKDGQVPFHLTSIVIMLELTQSES